MGPTGEGLGGSLPYTPVMMIQGHSLKFSECIQDLRTGSGPENRQRITVFWVFLLGWLLLASWLFILDFFFFFFKVCIFFLIYLFMAVLGLRFCARASSSCGKRGPLFIAVRGPLTIAAPLVAEHRLQMRRLSSCGSQAQLLHGVWDLPRPGLEPVSPALAGRLSTTAPPGKPLSLISFECID